MKKLIISLAVLAASISGAHAADVSYFKCRSGMIQQDGSLAQTAGQFAVIADYGNKFALTVINLKDLSSPDIALMSPELNQKIENGVVKYGDSPAGRFIKASNGNYGYSVESGLMMAIDLCKPLENDSIYIKKLQNGIKNLNTQLDEVVLPKGGINYFCEEGSKANISDDKKVFTLIDPDKRSLTFKILNPQPVPDATSYELKDTVVQIYNNDVNSIVVNFGHGADFQCSKSRD